MIGGVVSHDDHHRDSGATGVVQIGQAITEPGTQVQQYGGRPAGDAGVAVGRSGGNTFEKP